MGMVDTEFTGSPNASAAPTLVKHTTPMGCTSVVCYCLYPEVRHLGGQVSAPGALPPVPVLVDP